MLPSPKRGDWSVECTSDLCSHLIAAPKCNLTPSIRCCALPLRCMDGKMC